MFLSNFIPVDDVLVSKEIAQQNFACDLQKCKGACCTLKSDFGAPLLEEEIDKIGQILGIVKENLPTEHIEEIEKNGFFDEKDGELMTHSLNNEACVFVYFENKIAKCGIERAFLDGKTDFKKPVSCHLFPIRITKFGGEVLRYEKFDECVPAIKNGNDSNIKLLDFCEESLTRKYSKKWFNTLKKIIGS